MSAIAIDYGAVRIGVAREITGTGIVAPLATVPPAEFESRLTEWISEFGITEVYVGLPNSLSGAAGKQATAVAHWAKAMAKKYSSLNWYWVDERLTSVIAGRELSEMGKSTKDQRNIVDVYAAMLILEQGILIRDSEGLTNAEIIE
jgi:putative Holliday junction resolvase